LHLTPVEITVKSTHNESVTLPEVCSKKKE